MWNIYKKELAQSLHSMLAYVFLAFFIAGTGIYYSHYCLNYGVTDYSTYVLQSITLLLILVVPVLTMRLIAEEKKQKTDQLLLTVPIKITSIVIGKYLAVLTLFIVALLVIGIFPMISGFFGEMNYKALFTGFIGYFLMGAALIAVGMFLSAMTENTVVAAALSFSMTLFVFLVDNAVSNIPSRPRYTIAFLCVMAMLIGVFFYLKSKNKIVSGIITGVLLLGIVLLYFFQSELYEDGIASIFAWFSVLSRFEDFTAGILNLSSIIYYLSFIVIFLMFTILVFHKESGRKGIRSASIAVCMVVVVITANLVVTKADFSYDVTSNKMYSISDQTKKILKELDVQKKEVTMYMLSSKANANEVYQKIIEQYVKNSKNITLKYKDLETYPNFAKKYLSDGEEVIENSVIVVCGEKSRYISSQDFVNYGIDYTTYTQYADSIQVEPKITEAINYVTSEETPILYEVEGHGEMEVESSVVSQLEGDNYELKKLKLLTEDKIPEDCEMLLIHAPQKDFTEDQVRILKKYLEGEGKLYLSFDPLAGKLANLEGLLKEYGITVQTGVIVENNPNYYTQGTNTYLIPEYGTHEITQPLEQQKLYVVMPVSGGLKLKDSETYTLTTLLESTEQSYIKTDTSTDTLEQTKEDPDGPFVSAVVVEKEDTPKLVVSACANGLLSQVNEWSSDANMNFFMNSINYLNQQESKISIRAKTLSNEYAIYTEFTRKVLSTTSIYILPAIFLLIGGMVLYRRKKL